jgi:hypothetical protein
LQLRDAKRAEQRGQYEDAHPVPFSKLASAETAASARDAAGKAAESAEEAAVLDCAI